MLKFGGDQTRSRAFKRTIGIPVAAMIVLGGCRAAAPEAVEQQAPVLIELAFPAGLAEPISTGTPRKEGLISRGDAARVAVEMRKRVADDAVAYALENGIALDYVDYCSTRLNIELSMLPADAIPFAMHYEEFRTWRQLNQALIPREIYERAYQIRCLAETRSALVEAAVTPLRGRPTLSTHR